VGTQYRSVIFTHSPEQATVAAEVVEAVQGDGTWRAKVVTQVEPLEVFYPAEAYHQDYFANNPNQPYCQVIIAPKVAKARHKYLERLKK
jgi:peptide-methionine (S)-S-oxide reductase